MAVSIEEVRRIAALARLALDEGEAGVLAEQLNTILKHMEVLGRLDGTSVPPRFDAAEGAPLRSDRVEFDPLRLAPPRFAPAWVDPFFVVPRPEALDAGAANEEGESG